MGIQLLIERKTPRAASRVSNRGEGLHTAIEYPAPVRIFSKILEEAEGGFVPVLEGAVEVFGGVLIGCGGEELWHGVDAAAEEVIHLPEHVAV